MKQLIILLFTGLLFWTVLANALSVYPGECKTISHGIPTSREDGTPLSPTEILTYKTYITDQNTYIFIGETLKTENCFPVNISPPGSYQFVVTASDEAGRESRYSNFTDVVFVLEKCDGDFNKDGIIEFTDLAAIKELMFTNDPIADLTRDGIVEFADLAIIQEHFFKQLPAECRFGDVPS